MKESKKIDCLHCKHLDTSDIPNLFCNINCELVNDTDFRYCPNSKESMLDYIEKHVLELEKAINKKDAEIKGLQTKLDEKELTISLVHKAFELACNLIDYEVDFCHLCKYKEFVTDKNHTLCHGDCKLAIMEYFRIKAEELLNNERK